jgi:hypothetical protein
MKKTFMMIPHLLGIAAATALVVFCTLLPFLPGSYDSLAVPLSEMAHVVGTLGLLLVPVGLLWLAAQRSARLVQKRHTFPLLALIASTLVWLGLCVAAIVHSGFVLGFAVVLLWGFVAVKAWANFRSRNAKETGLPFYLIAVPVLVAVAQFVFVNRAIEYSRNRAITNSASLIARIEEYRTRNGRYPTSLLAEGTDHSPGVIGISQYHYEPHGDGYNLVFEQFNYNFGMREFVVYNPRDEQVMTAHAIDILQLTPAELVVERTRGHFARHDLPQPHWKRFWFD